MNIVILRAVLLVACVFSVLAHAERTTQGDYQFLAKEVKPETAKVLKRAMTEIRLMRDFCAKDKKSSSCKQARINAEFIGVRIELEPSIPEVTRANFKQCLYGAVVACSLLGGPDPESQGLSPLSSLSGQELTYPEYHFLRPTAEYGDGPKGAK